MKSLVRSLINLALSMSTAGRPRVALALAKLFLRVAPSDPRGPRLLSQVFMDAGDVERAEEALRWGLEKWPDSADLMQALSRHLCSQRRFDEMAEVVERLSQAHPDASVTYQEKAAVAFFRRGEREKVPGLIEEALARRAPDDEAWPLVSMATLLLHVPGHRARAESILREAAMRIRRGDPRPHMMLAYLDRDARPKTAQAHLEQARRMWPGSRERFEEEFEQLCARLEAGGVLPTDPREARDE